MVFVYIGILKSKSSILIAFAIFRQIKNEEVMRLAGEMKRERDEAREKEEILLELHEGRMREAERRREALELELEIRKRLAFREAIQ